MPSLDQIIVWAIVGLLGGSLAGVIMTWKKRGWGWSRNLAVGLAGALVGGFFFRIFGLWPQLDLIAISLRDIVSAVLGSFAVLAALWFWSTYRAPG